jgi:hypothetical protein
VSETPPDPQRIQGLRAVAHVLGCSVATVKRLLRRKRDPLRLLRADHEREPWHLRSRLLAFRRRWRTPEDAELLATVLEGWLRIAKVARVTVRQAQELARREVDPLPVWYTRTGRARALPCALRDWYDGQQRQHVIHGGPTVREDVCPPRQGETKRRAA